MESCSLCNTLFTSGVHCTYNVVLFVVCGKCWSDTCDLSLYFPGIFRYTVSRGAEDTVLHVCHEQLPFVTNYTYWNIYYTFLMYGFVCNFPSRSLLTHRTLLVAPRLLPPSYCTHCLCTRYSIDTLIKYTTASERGCCD